MMSPVLPTSLACALLAAAGCGSTIIDAPSGGDGSTSSAGVGSAGGAPATTSTSSTTASSSVVTTSVSSSSSSASSSSSSSSASSSSTSASSSSTSSSSSSSTSSSSSGSSSTSASSSSSSTSSSSTSSSSGGSILDASIGCGVGGKVAWNYVFEGPPFVTESFQLATIAAGPQGHVAVGSAAASTTMSRATSVILDPTGAATDGPTIVGVAGASNAIVSPLGFDRNDGILFGYDDASGGSLGNTTDGFFVGLASKSFTHVTGFAAPYLLSIGFVGRDAAGESFVRAEVTSLQVGGGVDLGGGIVTAPVLAEYDAAGAFVRTLAEPLGTLQVGALGHLFSLTSVSGTVDYGCGTVGTASVARTVITKRDATGACLFSKTLPASTTFALDPSENVLLATTFSGSVDFGGGALKAVGTSDLALAKLNASGNHVWSKSFGASGGSVSGIAAIGATNDGGASLVAKLGGAVDFGCGAVSSASASTLIAKFDASGTVVYSRLVNILKGMGDSGFVVDGLGGASIAVQLAGDLQTFYGPIAISRFAP